jgi:hypothetical protein
MLGEQLGELKGKITGRRVLGVTNDPTLEISVSRGGRLKGVEVTDLVTYCTSRSSDGSWHAKGDGVIMTKDGSETVTHIGGGIGYLIAAKARYAGSLFFGTTKGKLEFLETMDNTIKLWEWK